MEDGMSIAYRRYFLPDAGKCVVISHGFCEFAEKYNEVAYQFLRAGYSVYVPEHRGHGYSGREVDDPELVHVQSYDSYVTVLRGLWRPVVSPKEEYRIVFAHSMGGAIAILALERYPQLLRRQFSPHRCAPCRPENIRGLLHGCWRSSAVWPEKENALPHWRDSRDFQRHRNLRGAAVSQESVMTICFKNGS